MPHNNNHTSNNFLNGTSHQDWYGLVDDTASFSAPSTLRAADKKNAKESKMQQQTATKKPSNLVIAFTSHLASQQATTTTRATVIHHKQGQENADMVKKQEVILGGDGGGGPPTRRGSPIADRNNNSKKNSNVPAWRQRNWLELKLFSLHRAILGLRRCNLKLVPFAASKEFYKLVCCIKEGIDDRVPTLADQGNYHSILIGQVCIAQSADAIRFLIKILTGIDVVGLPLVFPASCHTTRSGHEVVKASFVKVWCNTIEEAHIIIAALHGRVLLDNDCAWFAEIPEQVVSLYRYCNMLQSEASTRFQHRPFAPLTAVLCQDGPLKHQKPSQSLYSAPAGATGYCPTCASVFHFTPTHIAGHDRNAMIEKAIDHAVNKLMHASPGTNTSNSNDFMKIYQVSHQGTFSVKNTNNSVNTSDEERPFPLLSASALYHCRKATEENWIDYESLTPENSNYLRASVTCGCFDRYLP